MRDGVVELLRLGLSHGELAIDALALGDLEVQGRHCLAPLLVEQQLVGGGDCAHEEEVGQDEDVARRAARRVQKIQGVEQQVRDGHEQRVDRHKAGP